MLSLLKKKSDSDSPALPAWHPNFRDYKKLPDIKVVRTAFFVNGLAALVLLSLATYFGFHEWKLRGVDTQLAQVEEQIARDKAMSNQAVALYKKFQVEEAKVVEVDTFLKSRPLVSPLLLRLAETMPKNVALDNFDLRDAGLSLRLSVRGDATAASGHTTSYYEQLRADKELELFSPAAFTGTPTRTPSTGKTAVEFILRAKAPIGGKKS